jgi:hypothetical protein
VEVDGDHWEDDAWAKEPESRATRSVRDVSHGPVDKEDRRRPWAILLAFGAVFVAGGVYAISRHGPIDIAFAVVFFGVAAYTAFLCLRATVRNKKG